MTTIRHVWNFSDRFVLKKIGDQKCPMKKLDDLLDNLSLSHRILYLFFLIYTFQKNFYLIINFIFKKQKKGF